MIWINTSYLNLIIKLIKYKLTTYCWCFLEVCSERRKCPWNLMGLPPPNVMWRNEMGRIFCEGMRGSGLRIPAHHGQQHQKQSYCCLAQLLQTCFCSVKSHFPHQNSPWLLVSVCGTLARIPRYEEEGIISEWLTGNREKKRVLGKAVASHANKAGTNYDNLYCILKLYVCMAVWVQVLELEYPWRDHLM